MAAAFGQRVTHLVAANDRLHGQMVVDGLLVGLRGTRNARAAKLGQRQVAGQGVHQRRWRTVGIVAEVRVPRL